MTRILGIDPGSRITGYGVVDLSGGHLTYVASGCIRTAKGEFPVRLKDIYQGVDELISQYLPMVFTIEEVFLAKNPMSALKLGQARGAAIVAGVAHDLPVFEYARAGRKQALVGTGRAVQGPGEPHGSSAVAARRRTVAGRCRRACGRDLPRQYSARSDAGKDMIGRLRGRVADITDNVVLLDVNGVGYEVEVTMAALTTLSAIDGEVTLFTHLVVREDAQSLYRVRIRRRARPVSVFDQDQRGRPEARRHAAVVLYPRRFRPPCGRARRRGDHCRCPESARRPPSVWSSS